MLDESKTNFSIAIVTALIMSVIIYLSVSCTTLDSFSQKKLQNCEDHVRATLTDLNKQGYQFVQGGDLVRPNGVLIIGEFLGVTQGKLVTEAMVDTAGLVTELQGQGLAVTGTCDRGGKEWTTLHAEKTVPTKGMKN